MKSIRYLLSGFLLILAAAVILLALLLSAARLILPAAGEYRDDVAAWVGGVLGQPVQIGGLRADWHGWGPSLELSDVSVLDAAGKTPVLQCELARIDINVLASLRRWQFEPGLLTVRGAHVSLVRRGDGDIVVMGLKDIGRGGEDGPGRGVLEQWLQRQERLAIEHSSLQWRDIKAGDKTWEFTDVNLELRNRGDRHRLDGTVNLPEALGQSLEVAVDVQGDLFTTEYWQGQSYVRGSAVRLGGWWEKQAPLGMAALDGVVDFRVWSDWLNGVQNAEGDIHARALHALRAVAAAGTAATAGHVDIAGLEGGFRWRRRETGWAVDVDGFSITRQGAASQPAQLRVEYAEDGRTGSRDVQAAYSALRAEDVAGLLLDADLVPVDLRARLGVMAPQGMINDGYLAYHSEPRQPPHFTASSAFSDLAWQASAPWPGVKGLSGRFSADDQQGVVSLATGKASVDFANLFRAPLPVDALAGQISWRRGEKSLRIAAPEVIVRNEDLGLKFAFNIAAPRDGGSPYVDFNANFGEGKGAHASRYLPAKIMGPAAVAWLDRAIVSGRVSGGSARLYGWLADFPFDGGQGLFEVRFGVKDGILEYAAGWPRLEGIDTEVTFHGRNFEAEAASAKSFNSEILQAKVAIPDMTARPAMLTVEGQARGPVADVLRYLTASPLRNVVGPYLDNVSGSGQGLLHLSLNLPLAKQPRGQVQANGSLRFDDGSVLFRDAGIDVTHIDGTLNFTEHGLAAKDVHAQLLGQPATISAATKAGKTGAITTFLARGTADAAALAKRFAPPLAPYLDGTAPWKGVVRIPPKDVGGMELRVKSSLRGVAMRLPPPMAKPADEARNLALIVPLPLKAGKPLHIRYDDIADVQLAFNSGAASLATAHGEVRFGGEAAVLPASGVRLAGTLPEFDVGAWSAILRPQEADKPAAAASAVNQVDMAFGVLKFAGRRLDKVRLQANRGDAAWDVAVNSDQAQGRIHVPDRDDASLVADMERLYLPRFQKDGADRTAFDPRKAHPLDIKVGSFHYGDLDLGTLRLRASRVAAGLNFDEVHTHSEIRDLKASGSWLAEGDVQRSALTLVYDGGDVGGTLTALGFAGMVVGEEAHTEMHLKWEGAPADFSLAKAAGSVSFEIKHGRLLDVEPGAGRILGLLSFQALPRHLLLDFSDIFQKGFSFDKVSGSFTIENGNAVTDNLVMAGPSARIEARGRVGLAAEDYDQRVMVTPNLTGGLPMAGVVAGGVTAGALTGGVGAGAAMLLMQRLLKPGIDKMTRVEYRVTGPWANPTVEKIANGEQDKKAAPRKQDTGGKKHNE